jgi:uridine phosphorylase
MAHNGLQMHLQCGPGDIAPAVLLPGDPGRVAPAAP